MAANPREPPGVPHVAPEDLPFRRRFGLRWLDALMIAVLAAAVAWRVVDHASHHTADALLGRPLQVGIVAWPGYAGGLVANNGLRASKDSAFWKRKLLVQFNLEENEKELLDKLKLGGDRGGFDVIWSTVDSLAQQYPELERIHPRAFMQVDWSRGGDAIVASADIKTIEDLRKKKIAVSKSPSQWLLEYSLESSTLNEAEKDEIRHSRTTTAGSAVACNLFVKSRVEAAVLWEPDVSIALHNRHGAHILIDTSTAPNSIADVMVASEAFIKQNPAVITAFIEGWLLDGTTRANTDPMQAVRVLQQEPPITALDAQATHDLLAKVALATLDDNRRMFGLSGGSARFDELFAAATELWMKRGYIQSPALPALACDVTALKEVYSAERASVAVRSVCGPAFLTAHLPVTFTPRQSDLTAAGRNALTSPRISRLLRTYSAAHFCVQASSDKLPPGPELSRAREQAVIDYLTSTYSLPRSQFTAKSALVSDGAEMEKVEVYVTLDIVGTGDR